jgi:hypothetical protein
VCGWGALQSVVQASDAEITQGLQDIDAVLIDGMDFILSLGGLIDDQVVVVIVLFF